MSHTYQAIGWNPFKIRYDTILAALMLACVGLFVGLSLLLFPDATLEIMLIRATGTAGFMLLHVILCIGPLARLHPVFLPLLYNRRHLGVTMFLLGLTHALIVVATYHAGSDRNPLVSILVSDAGRHFAAFPFQPLGLAALAILFFMAVTSHDFWLSVLTAPVWKALHMLVYVAYALLVLHVAFGVLQAETSPWLAVASGSGAAVVFGLHLVAGRRERTGDTPGGGVVDADGFCDVCAVDDIPEKRACIVPLAGERVAVFRYDGRVAAVSNVCQHQNGPLGEGRIIEGCITCPWHGYQYRPETGASPPPFTEKIPTFRVRLAGGRVQVHPQPLPPGTPVEPAVIKPQSSP